MRNALHRFSVLALLLAIGLGGCGSSTTKAANEALTARVVDGVLTLGNRTSEAVHYTVLESDIATRVDLYLCTAPEQCPAHIAPGASVSLRVEDIMGYAPGAREALVYAWYFPPRTPAGYTVQFLPSLHVPLR